MRSTPLFGLAAGLSLLVGTASAQLNTLAREAFEYTDGAALDQASGDLGWFQQWYAGCCFGSGSAGTITSPGFGGTGLKVTMTGYNEGAFRQPHTGTWQQGVAPGLNFGADDTTIWVSFRSRRPSGSDSRYGGLSLHKAFDGEKLFLGAPFDHFAWGIAGSSVLGSDISSETHLVYRIDYLPGDERARLWINPASAHPSSPPDLDVTVPDHIWNEIRLQTGEAPSNNAWDFDEIRLECDGCSPNNDSDAQDLSVSAGGTQTITFPVGDAYAGSLFLVLGSASGTSPGLPFGSSVIPLNLDAYFNLTLGNPNAPPLGNSFASLDGIGWAFTTFSLPASSSGALVGLSVDHALLALQVVPTLDVPFVSEPVALNFVP